MWYERLLALTTEPGLALAADPRPDSRTNISRDSHVNHKSIRMVRLFREVLGDFLHIYSHCFSGYHDGEYGE